jgi:enoyl-[acyl-carrier protein] reductase I
VCARGGAADGGAGGGSILTMTYLGGERRVPHYNVMGVAKAALDASCATSPGISARRTSASTRSRRAGAHAGGALDRRLSDDGGDRRGALAAAPPRSTPTTSAPRPRTCSRTTRRTSRDDLYVDSGYHSMGM